MGLGGHYADMFELGHSQTVHGIQQSEGEHRHDADDADGERGAMVDGSSITKIVNCIRPCAISYQTKPKKPITSAAKPY